MKPQAGCEEIKKFVKEQYLLNAGCEELEGERDQNFLLRAADGSRYVLKLTNPGEKDDFIRAQNEVLEYMAGKGVACPVILNDITGSGISEFKNSKGEKYRVRIVSYLPGRPLGSLEYHPPELLHDLGRKLGYTGNILKDFHNTAFKRKFKWDLRHFEETVNEYYSLVDDDRLRAFIDNTMDEFSRLVKPELPHLRRSIIHNDVNDYNIIVNTAHGQYDMEPAVEGFIDFGDMVYSYTLADPAVAMAYIMAGKDDPLRAASQMLAAYNESFRLEDKEIKLIFTMAKMRLCLSICIAAGQLKERPGDEYLAISQEPIRNTVPVLEKIHPLFAENVFREACGLALTSGIRSLNRVIEQEGQDAFPVTGEKLSRENSLVLDLSPGSSIVEGDPGMNTAEKLGERINREMDSHNKKYGIGCFAEPRLLYSSPVFQNKQFTVDEDRTIHLGCDIFAPAGADVFAPFDAVVHSFKYNPGKLDYGHMIILEHKLSGNQFYTLYGHLGKSSFEGLSEGKKIKKGEAFACTGSPGENGGWPPHLHFQIISHLLNYGTDYPGVCKPGEINIWQAFSPDPNLILNIPDATFPQKERGTEEVYRARKKYFAGNLGLSYRKPLRVVRGWQQFLFDNNGQKYLDAYNNVPHIGHSHPELAEAVCSQVRVLNTNTRYLGDRLNEYAEMLLGTFSGPLEKCFFLNSASEANELALRLAYAYTRRKDTVVMEGAYHGNTNTLIDISPYKHSGPGGSGAPAWVHTVPVPDRYRGQYKYDDPAAGMRYAGHVAETADRLVSEGRPPAAFIAETCPSVAGQIILPEDYLREVYKYMRECGAVCIADEVQTAYGRMGTSFYAFEDQDVIPDIVVLGKPIGNGHPLAAVVTTAEIAAAFDNGMEFFSTFGGNTVSAAAGKKVLEIVLRDDYMRHAAATGSYLLDLLKALKDRYPIIGDVRGSGLFIGVELVSDRDTLEPASAEASYIKEKLRDHNILTGTDGLYDNVLKIRPPMPFNKDDAGILADRLRQILETIQ